jgi:hypothetical protein
LVDTDLLGLAALPMKRNSGWSASRPIARMAATAISAWPMAQAKAATTDASHSAAIVSTLHIARKKKRSRLITTQADGKSAEA